MEATSKSVSNVVQGTGVLIIIAEVEQKDWC
jgi:hypothetical protein